jgi:hypothetical protein
MECDIKICKSQLVYGTIFHRPERCKIHREAGDINVVGKRCISKNCKNIAVYNVKNNPCCKKHSTLQDRLCKRKKSDKWNVMPRLEKVRCINKLMVNACPAIIHAEENTRCEPIPDPVLENIYSRYFHSDGNNENIIIDIVYYVAGRYRSSGFRYIIPSALKIPRSVEID